MEQKRRKERGQEAGPHRNVEIQGVDPCQPIIKERKEGTDEEAVDHQDQKIRFFRFKGKPEGRRNQKGITGVNGCGGFLHGSQDRKEPFPPEVSCISKVSQFVHAEEGAFHLQAHEKMEAEENKIKKSNHKDPVGSILFDHAPVDSLRQVQSHTAIALSLIAPPPCL